MTSIPPTMGPIPTETPKKDEHVDYNNLPCPIPYEELQRESMMALKPESFEGSRLDYLKALSPKFFLTHSVTMGPVEIDSGKPNTIMKIPTSNYEFGANYIDPKLMLVGRISHEGRLSGRLRYDLLDDLTLKANGQLTSDPHQSHVLGSLDYKGKDYRTQIQFGTGVVITANYIQSVTPKLAMGGEIMYAGQQRQSIVGCAARYNNEKMVATGQVATNGVVALSYHQKASEKVSLATDMMYNYISRDVTASVGYDVILRQARVRGKIDTNGCVTSFYEQRLNPGLNLLLSAELDHRRKDYKFGVGMSVGE